MRPSADTLLCVISTDTVQAKIGDHLSDVFREAQVVYAPVLPSAAEALVTLSLARHVCPTILWVADGPASLESMHQDLMSLRQESPPPPALLYYPCWESIPAADSLPDPEISGQRMAALLSLRDAMAPATPRIIVTCVQALLQKTIAATTLERRRCALSVGDACEMDDVAAQLVDAGYVFVPEVDEHGQASRRGGILDIWPPNEAWPYRLEFFGSDVESIRSFDPVSQRSRDRVTHVIVSPACELPPASIRDEGAVVDWPLADLSSYLPPGCCVIWSKVERIDEHAEIYYETIREARALDTALSLPVLDENLRNVPDLRQIRISEERASNSDFLHLGIEPVRGVFVLPRDLLQPDAVEEMRKRLLSTLQRHAEEGKQVTIFFDTEGSRERFEEQVSATDSEHRDFKQLATRIGVLSEGFLSESLGAVVVAESDLTGQRKSSGRRYDPRSSPSRPSQALGPRLATLEDVEPGDYVVHIEHGVGRYLGMREILFNGRRQEVLTVEYADQVKLHVPVSQAHLLTRYVGVARRQARVHRLGGRKWTADREAAQRAIIDLASQLLETQAARNMLAGHAFPADNAWQQEFDASFPYRETLDQVKVIRDVKTDMQATKPMDRLVCGDAGYGKTEVALRAAFKAVMGERQVAVLVPTTVLAQQHFQTFRERMSSYPVRVEMLSRFVAKSRQRVIKDGLESGSVDIVIGTHGLLQPDVRFKDLGLVIIDEEQRFGVIHKERFKELRRLVDVLTLTATPIPRTLYMSLTGARDMSLLQTPPLERMAIETVVTRGTDEVIRRAILRELNREGQVFFLHNRVMTIDYMRERLHRIVPEARIEVGHGQMPTAELSNVMRRFSTGQFDVLLCTTIIESGVDIPRANTILIDRADRFGIADLYQLRGRVGRSSHKAYAYLLLPERGAIDSDARERISAVRKYSSLSAGFNLAMRDLELRGAGNLLGAAQSGHITAIGFGLYCQLLQRTVAQMKNEPVAPVVDVELKLDFIDLSPSSGLGENTALIPYTYIDDERMRIGVYHRLAALSALPECGVLREELADRFGSIPPAVDRLLLLAEMRIQAHERGIQRIEVRDTKVMMRRHGEPVQIGGRFPRLQSEGTDARLAELREIIQRS